MTRTVWAIMLLTTSLLWTATARAQLAEVEQQAMSDTFQYALENNPTDRAADWVNPDTEHTGAVVPVRTFTNARGQPCREFITTITIGGEPQQGYGTACRQPDGTWQIVSDQPPAQVTTVVDRPVYVYRPAERYYVYPHAYYNPYRIYFSFSWLFHDGRLHIGSHYPGVSLWYHPYYRHPHRHPRHRYYAPLPHHRWYRREHIHRSWQRRHHPGWRRPLRIQPNRYIHRDRDRIERRIPHGDSRIERRIQRDRGRIERRIQQDRGRIERGIQRDRGRILRGDSRIERRIQRNQGRIERGIQTDRGRLERHIHRDRNRNERRIDRQDGRSGGRLDGNRNRGERRFNRL